MQKSLKQINLKKNLFNYLLKCISQYRSKLHDELSIKFATARYKVLNFLKRRRTTPVLQSTFRSQVIPQFYTKKLRTLFQFTYLNKVRNYGWLEPLLWKCNFFLTKSLFGAKNWNEHHIEILHKIVKYKKFKSGLLTRKNNKYSSFLQKVYPYKLAIRRKDMFIIRRNLTKIILPIYGHLHWRQFRKIYWKPHFKKTRNIYFIQTTGGHCFYFFENRLDVLIYKLNFAPTILAARILIKLGAVYVNGYQKRDVSERIPLYSFIQINPFFHNNLKLFFLRKRNLYKWKHSKKNDKYTSNFFKKPIQKNLLFLNFYLSKKKNKRKKKYQFEKINYFPLLLNRLKFFRITDLQIKVKYYYKKLQFCYKKLKYISKKFQKYFYFLKYKKLKKQYNRTKKQLWKKIIIKQQLYFFIKQKIKKVIKNNLFLVKYISFFYIFILNQIKIKKWKKKIKKVKKKKQLKYKMKKMKNKLKKKLIKYRKYCRQIKRKFVLKSRLFYRLFKNLYKEIRRAKYQLLKRIPKKYFRFKYKKKIKNMYFKRTKFKKYINKWKILNKNNFKLKNFYLKNYIKLKKKNIFKIYFKLSYFFIKKIILFKKKVIKFNQINFFKKIFYLILKITIFSFFFLIKKKIILWYLLNIYINYKKNLFKQIIKKIYLENFLFLERNKKYKSINNVQKRFINIKQKKIFYFNKFFKQYCSKKKNLFKYKKINIIKKQLIPNIFFIKNYLFNLKVINLQDSVYFKKYFILFSHILYEFKYNKNKCDPLVFYIIFNTILKKKILKQKTKKIKKYILKYFKIKVSSLYINFIKQIFLHYKKYTRFQLYKIFENFLNYKTTFNNIKFYPIFYYFYKNEGLCFNKKKYFSQIFYDIIKYIFKKKIFEQRNKYIKRYILFKFNIKLSFFETNFIKQILFLYLKKKCYQNKPSLYKFFLNQFWSTKKQFFNTKKKNYFLKTNKKYYNKNKLIQQNKKYIRQKNKKKQDKNNRLYQNRVYFLKYKKNPISSIIFDVIFKKKKFKGRFFKIKMPRKYIWKQKVNSFKFHLNNKKKQYFLNYKKYCMKNKKFLTRKKLKRWLYKLSNIIPKTPRILIKKKNQTTLWFLFFKRFWKKLVKKQKNYFKNNKLLKKKQYKYLIKKKKFKSKKLLNKNKYYFSKKLKKIQINYFKYQKKILNQTLIYYKNINFINHKKKNNKKNTTYLLKIKKIKFKFSKLKKYLKKMKIKKLKFIKLLFKQKYKYFKKSLMKKKILLTNLTKLKTIYRVKNIENQKFKYLIYKNYYKKAILKQGGLPLKLTQFKNLFTYERINHFVFNTLKLYKK